MATGIQNLPYSYPIFEGEKMEDIILEAIDMGKSYGEHLVLKDVNFNIKKGQIVGLIGANGAGKTTLLKSIVSLIKYDQGRLVFNGQDILEKPENSRQIGVLIEAKFINHLTAKENLELLLYADGKHKEDQFNRIIDESLELVSLDHARDKKVKDFSYGMRQRLGLCQAVTLAESLLILDEPFLGLDPVGKEIVKNVLVDRASDGLPIFLSSHDLDEVEEICDEIVLIKDQTSAFIGPIDRTKKYIFTLKNYQPQHFTEYPNVEILEDNRIKFVSENEEALARLINYIIENDMAILDIDIKTGQLEAFF